MASFTRLRRNARLYGIMDALFEELFAAAPDWVAWPVALGSVVAFGFFLWGMAGLAVSVLRPWSR